MPGGGTLGLCLSRQSSFLVMVSIDDALGLIILIHFSRLEMLEGSVCRDGCAAPSALVEAAISDLSCTARTTSLSSR